MTTIPIAKSPPPPDRPAASVPIVDEIAAAIALKADGAVALWVSSEVLALLERAVMCAPSQTLETFGGLPVIERPAWRWGYVIVDAA